MPLTVEEMDPDPDIIIIPSPNEIFERLTEQPEQPQRPPADPDPNAVVPSADLGPVAGSAAG